jgi:hypothetical protein
MTGTYSAAGVNLIQDHWISHPAGYLMVNLNAGPPTEGVLSGNVSYPGWRSAGDRLGPWGAVSGSGLVRPPGRAGHRRLRTGVIQSCSRCHPEVPPEPWRTPYAASTLAEFS